MPPRARREFVWTDDEAELLLNITIEYKTLKAAESVDWESVKSKYADIFELFKRSCLLMAERRETLEILLTNLKK